MKKARAWSANAFVHQLPERKLKRLWLVLTDFHCGSIYGVLPPGFEYITDKAVVPVAQNRAQVRLWEYVQDIKREADRQNPDTVLLLSDMTDGTNRKTPGVHRSMVTLDAQVQAAAAATRQFCTAPDGMEREVQLVSGSGYHASMDMSVDFMLATQLGHPQGFNGKIGNFSIAGTKSKHPTYHGCDADGNKFENDEVKVNAIHGASAAAIYLATLLDRTSLHASAASAALDGGFPNYDLIIQGHLHRKMILEANDRKIVLCPCLKLFEPWDPLLKLYARNAVPDLGATWLYFFDNGDIDVKFQTFPNIPVADALRRV